MLLLVKGYLVAADHQRPGPVTSPVRTAFARARSHIQICRLLRKGLLPGRPALRAINNGAYGASKSDLRTRNQGFIDPIIAIPERKKLSPENIRIFLDVAFDCADRDLGRFLLRISIDNSGVAGMGDGF